MPDETKREIPMPKDKLEKVPSDRLQNPDPPKGSAQERDRDAEERP